MLVPVCAVALFWKFSIFVFPNLAFLFLVATADLAENIQMHSQNYLFFYRKVTAALFCGSLSFPPIPAGFFDLKMEAIFSSETSGNIQR
jgi:hypothetical protein